MKLSQLKPDRRNANRGTKRGAQMLSESLKAHGAGRSILIDKHGAVIAGNKTVAAAGGLGMNDVLVVKTTGRQLVAVQRTDLDLETDAEGMALAIADNRTAEVGLDWSPEALAALGREGVDLEPFFSSEDLAGFYSANVETALQRPDDDVPDLPADAVTKPGDLIVLGAHQLLCGDATDPAAVKRLMGKAKADLLLTDPPYNVNYKGGSGLKILNDNQVSAGWKEGEGHFWANDRKQTTVLEFDRPARSAEHPTMKPVALFEYLMLNNTKPGDVVLDLFGGSGTTVIAAQKWGRSARLVELDPRYCDVIVQRFEDATGEKARRP